MCVHKLGFLWVGDASSSLLLSLDNHFIRSFISIHIFKIHPHGVLCTWVHDLVVFVHVSSISWWYSHTYETCILILDIILQTGFTYVESHHLMGLPHLWHFHTYFLYIPSNWLHRLLTWHQLPHQSFNNLQVFMILVWHQHVSFFTSMTRSKFNNIVIAQNDTSLPVTTFLCFRCMSTLHEKSLKKHLTWGTHILSFVTPFDLISMPLEIYFY